MASPAQPRLDQPPSRARVAPTLTLVLGLWYIIAAWVLGPGGQTGSVWNNVVVGILIAVFAWTRMNALRPSARWADVILGIWAFFSPWIYGYVANEPRFVNSLCVGVLVFALSIWGPGTAPAVIHRPQ
jgi:hypothetical protein